jgi:hypothetical protein
MPTPPASPSPACGQRNDRKGAVPVIIGALRMHAVVPVIQASKVPSVHSTTAGRETLTPGKTDFAAMVDALKCRWEGSR